jgi:hypothetical protein
VLYRRKALRRRVSAGIHLIGQLLHRHLELVVLSSRAAKCKKKGD